MNFIKPLREGTGIGASANLMLSHFSLGQSDFSYPVVGFTALHPLGLKGNETTTNKYNDIWIKMTKEGPKEDCTRLN